MGSQFINFKIKILLNSQTQMFFGGLIKTSCVYNMTLNLSLTLKKFFCLFLFLVENYTRIQRNQKFNLTASCKFFSSFGAKFGTRKIRFLTKFNMKFLFNLDFLKLIPICICLIVWTRLELWIQKSYSTDRKMPQKSYFLYLTTTFP